MESWEAIQLLPNFGSNYQRLGEFTGQEGWQHAPESSLAPVLPLIKPKTPERQMATRVTKLRPVRPPSIVLWGLYKAQIQLCNCKHYLISMSLFGGRDGMGGRGGGGSDCKMYRYKKGGSLYFLLLVDGGSPVIHFGGSEVCADFHERFEGTGRTGEISICKCHVQRQDGLG